MADKKPPIDPEKMRLLEHVARQLGQRIDEGLGNLMGERTGFVLVLFSFEGSELTYLCNSQRADAIKMLEELLAHMKGPGSWTTSEGRN